MSGRYLLDTNNKFCVNDQKSNDFYQNFYLLVVDQTENLYNRLFVKVPEY
jgi:hypothetical protein